MSDGDTGSISGSIIRTILLIILTPIALTGTAVLWLTPIAFVLGVVLLAALVLLIIVTMVWQNAVLLSIILSVLLFIVSALVGGLVVLDAFQSGRLKCWFIGHKRRGCKCSHCKDIDSKKHEWLNCLCVTCGLERHRWDNGQCKVCKEDCSHAHTIGNSDWGCQSGGANGPSLIASWEECSRCRQVLS